MIKIEDLRTNAKERKRIREKRKEIPDESGIYSWWCDEEKLVEIISKIYNENITEEKIYSIESESENPKEHGLFCIYVGQTKSSLKKRIIYNHISGNIRCSTLRRTLCAIYEFKRPGKTDEEITDAIDQVIDDMYIEYHTLNEPNTDIDTEEEKLINSKLRILNIKDLNDTIATENGICIDLRNEIVSKIKDKRRLLRQYR